MTQIRTWPRSYPDKHQVWKFSVAEFSSYHSIKKWGQTDGRTDWPQMTRIQTFNSRLPEKYSSYCSTKKVWTDGQTDSLTDRRCDNYIFNVGALIIMHKKELMWLIRSNNWPMQIRLSTCGFIALPVTTRVPFWVLLRNLKKLKSCDHTGDFRCIYSPWVS